MMLPRMRESDSRNTEKWWEPLLVLVLSGLIAVSVAGMKHASRAPSGLALVLRRWHLLFHSPGYFLLCDSEGDCS